MSARYASVFKTKMLMYGLTLVELGKRIGKAMGEEKGYSKQRIHAQMNREDESWKQKELQVWCSVLKVDYKKLVGINTEE